MDWLKQLKCAELYFKKCIKAESLGKTIIINKKGNLTTWELATQQLTGIF